MGHSALQHKVVQYPCNSCLHLPLTLEHLFLHYVCRDGAALVHVSAGMPESATVRHKGIQRLCDLV